MIWIKHAQCWRLFHVALLSQGSLGCSAKTRTLELANVVSMEAHQLAARPLMED